MKRAASGFSRLPETVEAFQQALEQARAELAAPPHTLWVVLSHHHAAGAAQVAESGLSRLPGVQIIVGSAYGAISDRGESELEPGLALLALADSQLQLKAHAVLESQPGELPLAHQLADGLGPSQAAWLFLRSRADWPETLAGELAERLGGALVSGGGIDGSWGEPPGVAVGKQAGLPVGWAVAVSGAGSIEWTLSQALAPAGPYVPVTRVVGDRLLSLDGQPAAEVARRQVGEQHFQAWAEGKKSLFVRVPQGESGRADRIFLCSELDRKRNALYVPGLPEETRSLALARLDGPLAEDEFRSQLTQLQCPEPAFAFYVNCCGRGLDLYGRLGVDAELFAQRFPGVPLLGLSSAFELAPREGGARVCGYTGVLVLVS